MLEVGGFSKQSKFGGWEFLIRDTFWKASLMIFEYEWAIMRHELVSYWQVITSLVTILGTTFLAVCGIANF